MGCCMLCRFFDYDDTSLPVCLLKWRYTNPEWTCAGFEAKK